MQMKDMAVHDSYNSALGCNEKPSNYRVGCEKDGRTSDCMMLVIDILEYKALPDLNNFTKRADAFKNTRLLVFLD